MNGGQRKEPPEAQSPGARIQPAPTPLASPDVLKPKSWQLTISPSNLASKVGIAVAGDQHTVAQRLAKTIGLGVSVELKRQTLPAMTFEISVKPGPSEDAVQYHRRIAAVEAFFTTRGVKFTEV